MMHRARVASRGVRCKSSMAVLDNPHVEQYADKPIEEMTLKYALDFGTKLTERVCELWHAFVIYFHFFPPQKVIRATQFLQKELPIRLAKAVLMFHHLPFIATVNPYMLEVMLTYLHTFETLRLAPTVETYEDVSKYLAYVLKLSGIHKNTYKTLSLGMAEVKLQQNIDIDERELVCPLPPYTPTHLPPQDLFMDAFIRARLSRRVLIAHQVKLFQQHEANVAGSPSSDNCLGVFDLKCRPKEVIQRSVTAVAAICDHRFGRHPEVEFSGDLDATFTYIPDHMEYLFIELLKNSMRHTVKWSHFHGKDAIPPIKVKICSVHEFGAIVKVCDEGGGFLPSAMASAWQWGGQQKCDTGSLDIPSELSRQQVANKSVAKVVEEKLEKIQASMDGVVADTLSADFLREWVFREHESDLGALTTSHTGLPCARAYARYMGGDIALESISGLGTNTYVYLSDVDGDSVKF